MNTRLILYIVIISGCGYIGMAIAGRIDKRISQIKALEAILTQLGFQLGFLAVPFKEALSKAAVCQRGAVRELMEKTVEILSNNPEYSAGEAFEGALRECEEFLYISQAEKEIMREFMVQTGRVDIQRTMDGIKVTSAKLKLAREENEARKNHDGKMYKGLGNLAGIFIVVLLL